MRTMRPMKKEPMKTMKKISMKTMKNKSMKAMQKNKSMKTMKKKKPINTMKEKHMKEKPMKGVVVGTALMGKQTKTTKNKKWIHVDPRYVKDIWVQVEVVQNKALVMVWQKDD